MKLRWKNVWTLLRSDLRTSFRSRGLFIILAMPLVLSVVMGFVLRDPSVGQVKVVFLGERDGDFARWLTGLHPGTQAPFKVMRMPKEEAVAALSKGKLDAVFTIPAGTSQDLKSGSTASIKALVDEGSPTKGMLAQNLVRDLARVYAGVPDPVKVEVDGLRGLSPARAMLPLWLVMTLLSAVTLLPATLAYERQSKTLDALLVAPVSYIDVVIGRGAYGVVVCVAGALMLLAFNPGAVGNPGLLALYIVLGSLMAVLLGVFIGLWRREVQSASTVASLLYLVLLWGTFFSELPGVISAVTAFVPTYYLGAGIRAAMSGTVMWGEQLMNLSVVTGTAIAALAGCVLALRKMEA